MPKFKVIVENESRRQVFEQEYASEGYARLSLYHVMADMLDSAIKESFPLPVPTCAPVDSGVSMPQSSDFDANAH